MSVPQDPPVPILIPGPDVVVLNPMISQLRESKSGNKMVQINTEYLSLLTVIENLISVSHDHILNECPEPVVIRMKLMREKHGPHPMNPSFTRFFRLSLTFTRFKVCLHLLNQYIPRELHPHTEDDEPDMLIKAFENVHNTDALNPFLFQATVEELHIRYKINQWFVYDDSCLLNSYIKYMDADSRQMKDMYAGQWNQAFEKYFLSLLQNPDIDVDLKEAAQKYPHLKIIRPLEVALRMGRYRAAIALISKRANVNLISIHDCNFMAGASLAFIYLTIFGFRFPSISELRRRVRVDDEEVMYWDAFLKWLENHRSATESLTQMCLQKIPDDPPEMIRRLFRELSWPEYIKQAIRLKRKNKVGATFAKDGTEDKVKTLKRPRFGEAEVEAD